MTSSGFAGCSPRRCEAGCRSTPATVPCTPRMRRTTGKCRPPSCCHARLTTSWRPSPRAAGTSMAGQACGAGLVVDMSRYVNRVVEIDPDRRLARVEPGVVLDDLRAAAAPYGLTFGPDPSSASRCTIGGMVGNNACGSHSVAWGTTADNVDRLEVLRYDGTRLEVGDVGLTGEIRSALDAFIGRHTAVIRQRFPPFSRRVAGYALDRLLPERGGNVARALVRTEGTCVTVLEATLRLVPLPATR